MSDLSAQQGASRGASRERDAGLERSTETKSAYKTTEFIIYLVAAAMILIAGLVVDGFNATETWRFFTFLTIGYMISRGLAKAGSRDPYRADS
jgi:F0F1-type ATP synthase assembly protein I